MAAAAVAQAQKTHVVPLLYVLVSQTATTKFIVILMSANH